MDQPAAPDGAPRAAQPGAVPGVARAAPAAAGRPRPAPHGAPRARAPRRAARGRRAARAVAARDPAPRARRAMHDAERGAAARPGRAGGALAGLRAAAAVELRAAGGLARGRRSSRPRSSTTAWTTSRPRRACERPRFRDAEARFAARADLVLASAPALAERMRTLNDARLLRAQRGRHRALRHRARARGRPTPAMAALPRPRIVFTGAVVATKLDLELLGGVARGAPGLVDRAGRAGRRRRPAHRHLGAAAPAERAPARRRGPTRSCPRCCAAPTSR